MDTRNSEWLNENSLRSYPLREDCGRIPCDIDGNLTSEEFSLPNYVIVDACVRIPDEDMLNNESTETPWEIFVSRVVHSNGYLTIDFSLQQRAHGVGNAIKVAGVTINMAEHVPNSGYMMTTHDSYGSWSDASALGHVGNILASIVIGDLSHLKDDLPYGTYNYTRDQTALETTCVRPIRSGIGCMRVVSNYGGAFSHSVASLPMSGDITFVAGKNINFTREVTSGGELTNNIRIDAEDGVNTRYNEYAFPRVSYINGINAEQVNFVGGNGIDVSRNGNNILLVDTNSKPCCGCAELAFINEKISEIITGISRLSNYSQMLSAQVSSLKTAQSVYSALGVNVTGQ